MEDEFKDISLYIQFRLNRLYDIYFSPPFTNDSNFYRGIQEYWIISFDRKQEWKNKLKYDK